MSAEFKAVLGQTPGGAVTCPYCQQAVEYDPDGKSLVPSLRVPFRYSRAKMERRASDYGRHKSPPDMATTPERWVAEDRRMPGTLHGYQYVKDATP